MKRLLGILTALLITSAVSTELIGCNLRDYENEYNSVNDDNNQLIIIHQEAHQAIRQKLDEIKWIDSNEYNFLNSLYQMVDINSDTLVISNKDEKEKEIFNFFVDKFVIILDDINSKLSQKYSNFYFDKLPIEMKINSMLLELKYLDVNRILHSAGLCQIDFNAIKIDFDIIITVKFKKMMIHDWLNHSYLISDDIELLRKISSQLVNVILPLIHANIFAKINTIIINKNNFFQSLYDDFAINFSQDDKSLDLLIKMFFLRGITINQELSNFDLNYNDNMKMIKKVSTPFDMPLTKNRDDGLNGVWGWSNVVSGVDGTANQWTTNSWVQYYQKSVLPDFNKTEKGDFILGNFTYDLSGVSAFGIPLNWNNKSTIFNKYDWTLTTTVEAKGMEIKLTNFANLIIAFSKFYQSNWDKGMGTQLFGSKLEPRPLEIGDVTKSEKLTLNQLYAVAIKDFKTKPEHMKMVDINLFDLKVLSDQKSELPMRYENCNFWDHNTKDTSAFTFNGKWGTGVDYIMVPEGMKHFVLICY